MQATFPCSLGWHVGRRLTCTLKAPSRVPAAAAAAAAAAATASPTD